MEFEFKGNIYIAWDNDDDPRVRYFVEIKDEDGSFIGDAFGETAAEAAQEVLSEYGMRIRGRTSSQREARIEEQKEIESYAP